MNQVVRQLLERFEMAEQKEKLGSLLEIGDYIEHPYPNDDGYVEVVQQLVVLLSKENDHTVRRELVRNIERAYMYNISLEQISFESLISILDRADPFLIRSILYLLSMTYDRKYIPVVENFLSNPDEEVRKEAQYILDTW